MGCGWKFWKTDCDDAPTTQRRKTTKTEPGTERLNEIKENLRAQNLPQGLITGGVAVVPELTPTGSTTTVSERGQTESFQKCDFLNASIAASTGPVVDEELNLSRSRGLRACLYARETEYANKSCRTAYTRALSIANQNLGTKPSGINDLISELGETGECPTLLNILQGKGTGRKPSLTVARTADSNKIPFLRNALNDYTNVQYHINLSMVPERDARRLQDQLARGKVRTDQETVDELSQSVRTSGSVTIASTGEINRNLVSAVEDQAQDDQAIEDFEAAFYKEQDLQQIESNLQAVARKLNEAFDDTRRTGAEIRELEVLTGTTARLTLNARVEREKQLTQLVNDLTATQNLKQSERTSVNVSDRNYYNIQSMKLANVHAPSTTDPFVSQLTSMEMVIAEPHGLSLNEDLKNLSNKLGYDTVNPGRVLYKVDIWFSGYNPRTGDWVARIPINDRDTSEKPVVSYYVVITGFEGNFDVKGTEYKLTFAPQGFMSIRPEEFSLEGTAIPTGENPTFGTFLKNLSEAITKKRRDETREALGGAGLNRIYKFYAPDVLMEAPFYQGAFLQRNNLVDEDAKSGMFVTIGKDIDILTLLRSALQDLPEVQSAFLTSDKNVGFVEPVTHFTVRFNVKYATKRPEINDYDGVVYEYIIEPFLSFKKLGFDATTVKNYVDPNSQKERIRNMLRLGMITRVYDYINTSENTDVLNFDIRLNKFYYESFKRSFDPASRKGVNTAATPSQVETASTNISLDRELQVNLAFSADEQVQRRFQQIEDSLLQKVFGPGVDEQAGAGQDSSSSPQTDAFQTLHASLGTTGDPDSYSSTTSDGDLTKKKDEYLQRFNDHFALDLITLDSLELRGDPVWLLSPYASSSGNTLLSIDAKDVTNGNEVVKRILQPHAEKVIFLNIKDVEQFDYMNPDSGERIGKPNIMAGFYGIIGSESTFENGKFTQKLSGYKMAHLNYAGQNLISTNLAAAASRPDQDTEPDNVKASEWNTQVLDQGAKLPQFNQLLSDYREAEQKKARNGDEEVGIVEGTVRAVKDFFGAGE